MGDWVVMRARRVLLVPLFWLFVSAFIFNPVVAEPSPTSIVSSFLLAQLSPGQAVNLIHAKTGGKVLSVIETSRRGATGYLIKVLMPEGRIRKYFVDGQTGAIAG